MHGRLFWKNRAEVSGAWKLHLKDIKSCMVTFCYCPLTGVFKGLRANFLPRNYIAMNLLVKAGKILYKKGKPSWKGKRVSIPDTGYEEWQKFPQLALLQTKYGKCVGPACSPPPSLLKNILPVMLVNTSANDKIEFTVLKILLFILLVISCI